MTEPPEQIKELTFGSWEHPSVEGTPPSPRYGHASAVVGSRMYMFGGISEDNAVKYHNDMFILHLGETLRWEAVDQQGDKPSGREQPTMNAIGEELYMFGGIEQEDVYTCAEGLYSFHTGSHTWLKRETSGIPPKAQSLSAVVYGVKIFTFGGVLNGEAQNSVHILDTDSMEWTLAQTTGTSPVARCDHACVVVGRRMYLTAGSGGNELWYNDLHTLNLDTLEWAEVKVEGVLPSPRDYTTLTNLSNWYLVMFAGFNDQNALSDLHFLDLTAKSLSWSVVAMETDTPTLPRYAHSTVLFENKLYVFAGQNEEQELNDVWAVQAKVPLSGFEPTPVPRTRYSLPTPVPAPRKTVTPAPPKEIKPQDFEELRSTYLKRINEMFDTLAEKFRQLDQGMETLAAEKAAFEEEKKAHTELYETQQQELKELLDSHKQQNEEWLEKLRTENDAERKSIAKEKSELEKATMELAADKEAFQEKSKKLDAIMKQVQGLTT